ncbi:hypothetical protein B7453_16555 [Pseudomonas sp. IB20]|nr:hypothetical protein B7453_16555 [Pseudomonas sp. IB20]
MVGNSISRQSAAESNAVASGVALGVGSGWAVSSREMHQPTLASHPIRADHLLSDTTDPDNLIAQIAVLLNALLGLLEKAKVHIDKESSIDKDKDRTTVVPNRPTVVVPENEPISCISNSPPGQPPGDVWLGLSEGEGSNSGVLAGIKAAMMRFGQSPRGVYSSVREHPMGCEVVMRDGYKVMITKDELAKAKDVADFRGTDPGMIKDAVFMYAVTAKREQERIKHAGISYARRHLSDPFEAAMQQLNDNFWAHKALAALGLTGNVRQVPVSELEAKGGIGVVTVGYDAMLMSKGYVDMYGPEKLGVSTRRDIWGDEQELMAHELV